MLVFHFNLPLLRQCQATLASYWGHLRKADSWQLRQRLLTEFEFLHRYFLFGEDGTMVARFAIPNGLSSARQQYGFYRSRFQGRAVFFQVGRFYEFYHRDDDGLAKSLGLQPMTDNRRGARFCFPRVPAGFYAQQLLRQGLSVLFVLERGEYADRIKQRLPVYECAPC